MRLMSSLISDCRAFFLASAAGTAIQPSAISLQFAANSVMPIVILIVLGYALKRTGLLTKEFLDVGNKIFDVFINLFLPFNFIHVIVHIESHLVGHVAHFP